MSFQFAVVVKTDPGDNAVAMDVKRVVDGRTSDNDYTEVVEDVPFTTMLNLRQPVFNVGEVLILDRVYGREQVYPGRKPSKWRVECEYYDDLEVAVARAREVFEQSTRRPK